MLLTILSRCDAEGYVPGFRPSAIVSVTDPESEQCGFDLRLYDKILRIQFHDVGLPVEGAITRLQATQIAAFLQGCGRDGVKELVVHCEAGISRSAGIGLAACRILDLDDGICYIDNRVPNRFVAAAVLSAHQRLRRLYGSAQAQ